MALLKCPECSNDVSEHAKFCPKCGCTIEYIVEFHRKKKAQQTPIDTKGLKIWDSLSEKQKGFLEEFKQNLEEAGLPYFFDKQSAFVGFRKKKGEALRFYLNRHASGRLAIHIYDSIEDTNKTYEFVEDKAKEFIVMGLNAFGYYEQMEQTAQEDDSEFSKALFVELESTLKYWVHHGKILPIKVTKVIRNDESYRIYFRSGLEAEKFCMWDSVGTVLFDSKANAERYLDTQKPWVDPKKLRFITLKPVQHHRTPSGDEYVLCNNNQFITGFHDRRHYDSVMSGYTFVRFSGNYVNVQVPDFSTDLSKALIMYDKESAENYAKELSEQLGYKIEAVPLSSFIGNPKYDALFR